MISRDKWLPLDSSSLGIKTGYTKEAGHCFVGCAKRNGMTIITVILKSDQWLVDQMTMVEWAYSNFENRVLVQKGERVATVPVTGGTKKTVNLVSRNEISGVVRKDGSEFPQWNLKNMLAIEAPIIANVTTTQSSLDFGGFQIPARLVADSMIDEQPKILSAISSPITVAGFLMLATGAYLLKRKAMRMGATAEFREGR